MFANEVKFVPQSLELMRFDGDEYHILEAMLVDTDRTPDTDYRWWKNFHALSVKDEGRLNMLIRDRHLSPFGFVSATFKIKTPLFIAKQWQRHRWAEYAEQSGRYTEFKPEFYIPEFTFDIGKGATYKRGAMSEYEQEAWVDWMKGYCKSSYLNYTDLLAGGVSKELAVRILPQYVMTTFMVKMNLRSITNFLVLRNDIHAQKEIRELAVKVEDVVKDNLPIFYKLWVEHGRPNFAST